MDNIKIVKGSLTEVEADAIVNPANSYGYMGGGVAGVIKEQGGIEIERAAIDFSPLEIGQAYLTTAGQLKFKGVIHAPTMEMPVQGIPLYNVAMATKGALETADDLGFKSLAFPGMGTGVGKVKPAEAAKAMLAEIKKFKPRHLQTIILADVNEKMVAAWEKEIGKK